jgi:hypothetical protein
MISAINGFIEGHRKPVETQGFYMDKPENMYPASCQKVFNQFGGEIPGLAGLSLIFFQ